MSSSDYIALAALGISILSALYARWSAQEAKRANDISLHPKKIAIYEEVVSFSDCFRGIFSVPTYERLQQFQKNAVQRSEIYLSKEVYLQLKEIYSHCSENEVYLNIATSQHQDSGKIQSELEVRDDYRSVLNLLYPAIELIKTEAQVKHS